MENTKGKKTINEEIITVESIDGIPRELTDLCSDLQYIAECKEGQLPIWDKKTYMDYDSSWWAATYMYRHMWLGENKDFLLRKYAETVEKSKAAVRKYQGTSYHAYLKKRITAAIEGMTNFKTTYAKFQGFTTSMQIQIDSLSLLCGKDIRLL